MRPNPLSSETPRTSCEPEPQLLGVVLGDAGKTDESKAGPCDNCATVSSPKTDFIKSAAMATWASGLKILVSVVRFRPWALFSKSYRFQRVH